MTGAPSDLQVAERFAVGLASNGVKIIAVLLTDEELVQLYKSKNALFDAYRKHKLAVVHYPIKKYNVPSSMETFSQLSIKLLQFLKNGSNVAIHCREGHGRTGILAVGMLITMGYDPEQAFKAVSEVRPVIDNPGQFQYVKQYSNYVIGELNAHGKNPFNRKRANKS
jgi:protein-tyrosine phosphatase